MPSYQDGIKTGMLLAAELLEHPDQLLKISQTAATCDCIGCLIRALRAAVDTMTIFSDEELLTAVEADIADQGRPN